MLASILTAILQAAVSSRKPSSHLQPQSPSHVPWPLQCNSRSQTHLSHAACAHVGLQVHTPVALLQVPWPVHCPGHASLLQSSPLYPNSHMHWPSEHLPWPEQPKGQSHATPPHPFEQLHVKSAVHAP